jgi:hypothetical protein
LVACALAPEACSHGQGQIQIYPMTNIAVGTPDGIESFGVQIARLGPDTNDPHGSGSKIAYWGIVPASQVTLGTTFFNVVGEGRVRVDIFGIRAGNIFVRSSMSTTISRSPRAFRLWLDGSCIGETLGTADQNGPTLTFIQCTPPPSTPEASSSDDGDADPTANTGDPSTSNDDGGAAPTATGNAGAGDAGMTGPLDYGYTCAGTLCSPIENFGLQAAAPSAPGGAAVCLDEVSCFANAMAVMPTADCTLPIPDGGTQVAVAAVVTPGSGAVCSGQQCLFELDPDSWQVANGAIKLIPTECSNANYLGFVVSTTCALANGEGICGAGGDPPASRDASTSPLDASMDATDATAAMPADASPTQTTDDAATDDATTDDSSSSSDAATGDDSAGDAGDGGMSDGDAGDAASPPGCSNADAGDPCDPSTAAKPPGPCTAPMPTCQSNGMCEYAPANELGPCGPPGTTCMMGSCM